MPKTSDMKKTFSYLHLGLQNYRENNKSMLRLTKRK